MQRGHRVSRALAIAGVLVGIVSWAAVNPSLGANKQVVTAARTSQVPAGLDDPVWNGAQAVDVPMEGKERFAGKKVAVSMKAVYTDDTVAMLFRWPDATHSVTKDTWQYDGTTWRKMGGNEDRISLLFEINRIDQFATKGCTVACHVPAGKTAKDGKFGTKTDAEKGDLWHWKAARSEPYGHADDTYIVMATEKSTGRKNDKGKGGDKANETADKKMPAYMQDPTKRASAAGFLLAEEAVKIADYSVFKTGDRVTYRMPVKPEGSRFDIKSVARHANGGWTVMLTRKLNTGSDDDVAFDPRREYSFAAAVFDDSGDEDSYDSEVVALRFGR